MNHQQWKLWKWETLRAQRKQRPLTQEEEAHFTDLDLEVQRKVVCLATSCSVGLSAFVMEITFLPAVVLVVIAAAVPWIALKFNWR